MDGVQILVGDPRQQMAAVEDGLLDVRGEIAEANEPREQESAMGLLAVPGLVGGTGVARARGEVVGVPGPLC